MSPLAERLRPKTLNELEGQEHLTGSKSILRKAIENQRIPSMILWGHREWVKRPSPPSLPSQYTRLFTL